MPFFQLAPAQKLVATYHETAHALVLEAAGEVQNYTGGFVFKAATSARDHATFSLFAWTGPLGEGQSPFKYSQTFTNIGYPGHVVRVVDANHPDGVHVPVGVVPAMRPGQASTSPQAAVAQPATPPPAAAQVPATTQSQVTVRVDAQFDIQSIIADMPGGTVSLDFDASFLTLLNAGVSNPPSGPQIVWHFKALRQGVTTVQVAYAPGGLLNYIALRPTQVTITA